MSKHRELGYNIRLPDAYVEPIQEFISTYVSENFDITLANSTTIQLVAGTDNDQVCCGISGKWRYISSTINRAHPGGAAGLYDVWVVTGLNIYVAGTPETDDTDYTFAFRILAAGSGTPATGSGSTAYARKVAQLVWDGAAIVGIIPLISGVTLHAGTHAPGATDPIDYTLVNLRGTLSARPPAATANAGLTYLATDASGGTTYRSTGTAWEQMGAPVSSGYGAGFILDFAGAEASIPSNVCVTDGRQISKTTFAVAYTAIGDGWANCGGLASPSAGNFRVPDLRGRGRVTKGDLGTGNAGTPTATGSRIQRSGITTLATVMGEEFHTLILSEVPSHDHGGSTGAEAAHTHTGTTGAGSSHTHGATGLTFTGSGGTTSAGSSHTHGVGSYGFSGNSVSTGGESGHTHGISDPGHGHSNTFALEHHTHAIQDNSSPGANLGIDSSVIVTDAAVNLALGTSTEEPDVSGWFSGGVSSNTTGISGTGSGSGHTHSVTATGSITGTSGAEASHTHTFTPAGSLGGSTAAEAAHTHTFTTGAGSSHVHSITAAGGGGSHENVHPVAVVVTVVTLQ